MPHQKSARLEETLRRAMSAARDRQHRYLTIEHLLLALLDDDDALSAMAPHDVDLTAIRAETVQFLDVTLSALATREPVEPNPTGGYNRILDRAETSERTTAGAAITAVDVLIELLEEAPSIAGTILTKHGMTPAKARTLDPRHASSPAADPSAPFGLSPELQSTLNRAHLLSQARNHKRMALDHLLYCLLDDPDAARLLQACKLDFTKLRADLEIQLHALNDQVETGPATASGTNRAIQVAVTATQRDLRKLTTGADLLIALFTENESAAVRCLLAQKISIEDIRAAR